MYEPYRNWFEPQKFRVSQTVQLRDNNLNVQHPIITLNSADIVRYEDFMNLFMPNRDSYRNSLRSYLGGDGVFGTSVMIGLSRTGDLNSDIFMRSFEEYLGTSNTNRNVVLDVVSREYTQTDTEENCAVCQMELVNGDMCSKLNCEHTYHTECINRWGLEQQTCPTCRTAIPFHINNNEVNVINNNEVNDNSDMSELYDDE